ncbi:MULTISPECIES: EcsC family protein [Acinetobacter]|uniref:EcsC family protein n=1 Tax=Acinetobacter TaxID=469 RepID=UPI0015D43E38|nr:MULTISPECIES: EcsC family protein [Acinetobacter]
MTDSNNKQSGGFLSSAFGVAKKLSHTGIDLVQHVAPGSTSKEEAGSSQGRVVEGSASPVFGRHSSRYDNPQQVLKAHLPQVSRQLLGRHYNKVNNLAHFVAPQFSDKVSDYFFHQLNTFTSNISSVDAVLDEAGVRDLEELTQDVNRSKRISQALAEQNKWLASIQGAITGATGVIGTAVDVPVSMIMSLRTIYQVGRSYGFELNKEEGQAIVQYIFKQVDLGLIAEKQAVLLGIKSVLNMLQTHDVHQLQQLVGSSNDMEALRKYLVNEQGEMKWQWMNSMPKFSLLSKLTPVATASVSAAYSWKLVEHVHQKAQEVFSHAREYLIQHKGSQLSPVDAYEKAAALLAQAAPKLLEQPATATPAVEELKLDQDIELQQNSTISKVKIQKKSAEEKPEPEQIDQDIQQGLEQLADKMVEPNAAVEPQKPAIPPESIEPEPADDDEFDDTPPAVEEPPETEAEPQKADAEKPVAKKVTKKQKAQ